MYLQAFSLYFKTSKNIIKNKFKKNKKLSKT